MRPIELVRRLRLTTARPPRLPRVAWFDGPGAADEIRRRATADADRRILHSWVDHGYAIVEQLVPHGLLDEMVADLARVFETEQPLHDVVLHDLVLADGHRASTEHRELLSLEPADRAALRDRSSRRIHGFYRHSTAADRIRRLPELRRIASMILGVDSEARYSINFHNGSRQALHQDSAVFHLGVPNLICGAWIACEDVVEGSGPLVFHPGSHRRPPFEGFTDYPSANLRTADATTSAAYRAYVEAEALASEERAFLARKGDVLFWHGMLVHGGQPIRDEGTTRRSYVLHFIPDGVDVTDRVTLPTNW